MQASGAKFPLVRLTLNNYISQNIISLKLYHIALMIVNTVNRHCFLSLILIILFAQTIISLSSGAKI